MSKTQCKFVVIFAFQRFRYSVSLSLSLMWIWEEYESLANEYTIYANFPGGRQKFIGVIDLDITALMLKRLGEL